MKYHKTVFRVEVLSPDEDECDVPIMSLGQIAEAIVDGDCSGLVECESCEELSKFRLCEECDRHGTAPEFFLGNLDDEEEKYDFED